MTVVDTQALIWLIGEPARLSIAAREALTEAEVRAEFAVAAITLSELAMLVLRRRIKIDRPVEGYLRFIKRTFVSCRLTFALRFGRISSAPLTRGIRRTG